MVHIFPDRLITAPTSSAAELHLYRVLKKCSSYFKLQGWRFQSGFFGSRNLHQKTGFWFLSTILSCTMQPELNVLLRVHHVSKFHGQ